MLRGVRTGGHLVRVWPDTEASRAVIEAPRDDLLLEVAVADSGAGRRFVLQEGPFTAYERTVERHDGELVETTRFELAVPWFGWAFRWPVRATLARRGYDPATDAAPRVGDDFRRHQWWAPPDRLDPRQVLVLGLLAAAAMSAAFTNTLFTQTAEFVADDFGVSDAGLGRAGSVVRAGIVLALPLVYLADRLGRRRLIIATAWLTPILSALGALAPSFPTLVASQALARPLGLALAVLIGVIAAEEMPRNSRAYAVSVLAMASGFGSGVAVLCLNLVGIAPWAWRLAYVAALIWLAVAVDVSRRMPETTRFMRPHAESATVDRRRFAILGITAAASNVFVAPASFFQNSYLQDARGYSGSLIALFTFATATPAGLGLIIGGRLADIHGRKAVAVVGLPLATLFVTISFSIGGPLLWVTAFLGGILGAMSYPALAVYRAELFPTAARSWAAGLLTAAALLGGIAGLEVAGQLLDGGIPHGRVLGLLGLSELAVAAIVVIWYPDTAHHSLEELNPADAPLDADVTADRPPA
jgi:MFS family permease